MTPGVLWHGVGLALAANVLAWEEDGVTHHIEATLGLGETLALAASLRPIS